MKTSVIEFVIFCFIYCLSLNASVQEELLNHKACLQLFNQTYCTELSSCIVNKNNTNCRVSQDLVQKQASKWGMYLALAGNIPSIFITLLFGIYSDKIGRKVFILIPIIGYIISNGSFAVVSYNDAIPVYYLFIGNCVAGFFGGVYAVLSSCFAYVADLTNESNRTKRVVVLEAMSALGAVVGNVTGGFIVEKFGYVFVYLLICGLYMVLVIYWFFLKETKPGVSWKRLSINAVFKGEDGIKAKLRVLFRNENGARKCVLLSYLILFLLSFCLVGKNTASLKKVLHAPLNFSPTTVGYFVAIRSVCVFIGSMLVNFICFHHLQWKDTTALLMATLGVAGYGISFGLAQTLLTTFLTVSWYLIICVAVPSLRSLISKLFDAADQGKVFASLAFIEAIAGLFTNVLVSYIYVETVSTSPSITIFIMAGVAFVVVLLVILLMTFKVTDKYKKLGEEETGQTDHDNLVHDGETSSVVET